MPKYGPDPAKKKHGNAKHTMFWPGSGENKAAHSSLSRQHFLKTDHQPKPHQTNFGSSQSIATNVPKSAFSPGLSPDDAEWWPKAWPAKGRVAKVPKCVILSSLPQWGAMWQKSGFYFPNDVIGRMFTPPNLFGNYYYIEQWDTDNPNTGSGRFHQKIGEMSSPYFDLHPQLLDTFAEVKAILEADSVDPIYCVIPEWFPREIVTRSQSDGFAVGTYNPAHHWDEGLFNVTPCLTFPLATMNIKYPDTGASQNTCGLNFQGVAPLLSGGHGFATNVLHIYVGHYAQRIGLDWNSAFSWESVPAFPEGQMIAGSYLGTYLGGPLSFFNGRRAVWRDFGFPYGYTDGLGAPNSLNNYYDPFIQQALGPYKDGFYKHRNWATKLYTYDAPWTVGLTPQAIYQDRYACTGLRFFFGFDIGTFNALFGGPDLVFEDESSAFDGLLVAKGTSYQPGMADLALASTTFANPIVKRIMNYYNTLDSGTANFYQTMIADNGLEDYGMTYEGGSSQVQSAGNLVDIIKRHFAKS